MHAEACNQLESDKAALQAELQQVHEVHVCMRMLVLVWERVCVGDVTRPLGRDTRRCPQPVLSWWAVLCQCSMQSDRLPVGPQPSGLLLLESQTSCRFGGQSKL